MTELQTVVAAVDDGDSSAAAALLGAHLADTAHGGRFFGVHCVPPIPAALEELLFPYAGLGEDYDELRAAVADAAQRRVARRLKRWAPQATPHVTSGDVVDGLLRACDELGPTILLAATAPDVAGRWHIGPTTDGLARRAPATFVAARSTPHTTPTPPKRIVACVDLTPSSGQVIVAALELAARFGGQVQPVYVAATAADLDPAGVLGNDRSAVGRAKRDITNRWAQIEASLDLRPPIAANAATLLGAKVVTSGDPGPKLCEVASEAGADLVVAGRSRGTGMGRVAEYLLRHAHAHVALVTLQDAEVAS